MTDTPPPDTSIDARSRAIIATIPAPMRRLVGAAFTLGLNGADAVRAEYGAAMLAELEAIYQRTGIDGDERMEQ